MMNEGVEITEKLGLHNSRHRQCGQKTMSALAKLAKEIDESRDVDQTIAECQLAV